MTQAVAHRTDNKLQVLVRSEGIASRFNEVLGKRAPQFISSLIQVGNSLGDDCDPMSIISGAMTAASLDLPINKNLGFAWLVPYKDRGQKKAQFQMGYKGYIQLALRTRQYSKMNARPLNAECLGGYNDIGEREVDFTKLDPYKPAAAYFFGFQMVNGFTKVCVWTKQEVEAHAQRYSQSYRGGYDSPWKTHFDEMACKTVIANELRQWGILSVELQQAAEVDGAIIRGLDNPEVTFPDATPIMAEVKDPDDGDLGPAKLTPTTPEPGPGHPAPTPLPATPTQPLPPEKPAQPATPVAPRAPRGSAATAAAVHAELQDMILNAVYPDGHALKGQLINITWTEFAKWADSIGMVTDATSLPGFEHVKVDEAKRVIRAKAGVIQGIIAARG